MRISLKLFLFIVLAIFAQTAFSQSNTNYPCLPKGITLDTVVSATLAATPQQSKKVYVKDKLKQLNARCSKKKLVDDEKRQIKFYLLKGCSGIAYSPNDPHWKKLKKQDEEIAELRKKFTVITLTCNPSGVPLP